MIYLEITPKAQATKSRINKWDYIKLKSFHTAKETINKVKRQSTEWGKVFANHISDKGLIYKVYKKYIQLNSQKKNHPNNFYFILNFVPFILHSNCPLRNLYEMFKNK